MKFAVVMFFTIFVAVISARRSARCSSSDDCDENECCISRTFLGFRKGYCKPLARDGENCSADEDELFGGKFVMHCPCERGLSCEPTEVKDLGTFGKIKLNERCVSKPISTEGPDTEVPVEETEVPAEE